MIHKKKRIIKSNAPGTIFGLDPMPVLKQTYLVSEPVSKHERVFQQAMQFLRLKPSKTVFLEVVVSKLEVLNQP